MAVNPEIVNHVNGGINIRGLNMTYEEIINSLGTRIYKVHVIRVEASSINQIRQPISLVYRDARGRRVSKVISPLVSPQHKQTSIRFVCDVTLDGKTSLDFKVLQGESMRLFLEGEQFNLHQLI